MTPEETENTIKYIRRNWHLLSESEVSILKIVGINEQ